MVPWDKLPKNLQKAVLTMIVLYGGTTTSCCFRPMICDPVPPPTTAPKPTSTPTMTPMVFDPPPPPTTAPPPTTTPTMTPMICDPPPPPSVAPLRHFQIRSFRMSSDETLEGAAVQGTVVNQQGRPLADLKVTARANGAGIDTWTDLNGAFFLPIPEPGAYLVIVGDDESHGLPLELKQHDLAIIEWVEIGQYSQGRLPLAEIRAVDIVWEDGLTFGAETPWPGARYRWSMSGGTLVGSGERVVWQPPAEPGRYLLQVVADWGHAGLAVDALVLVVEEDGNVTIC